MEIRNLPVSDEKNKERKLQFETLLNLQKNNIRCKKREECGEV